MRMEICQFILPLSCLLLLTTTRALDINYPLSPVCAVTGSTVVIPCEFAYPQSLRVETFMWCHNDVHCEQPTHVCHSDNTNINADYWGRAECLGDRVKNCALKIKDIKDTDAGVYQFGFTSSYVTGISVGWPGVTLQVCELKVMVTRSKGVREGDSVILTCDTESCSLSQSEFTWFKDDQPMTETKSTLHFSPVCKYHSGKYSCALKDSKVSNKMDLIVQGGAWTVDYPEETQCAVRRSTEVFQWHILANWSLMTVILMVLGILLYVLPIIICIIGWKIKLLCNRGGNRGGIKQSCHSDSDNNTYAVKDTAASDRDPARQKYRHSYF
nr:sialoadhesin-like isoform X2 [Paramormyrops kingsleyae]